MTPSLQLTEVGQHEQAWQELLLQARDVSDYVTIQRLCRKRQQLVRQREPPQLPARARVALLSGATTSMLEGPLQLCLEALGVNAEIQVSQFNSFAREMLDPQSVTAQFAPDVAVLIITTANLPAWPRWNASAAEVDVLVEQNCDYWLRLCAAMHEHAGCDVVLPNFHPLPTRPLGTAAGRTPGDANRFLSLLNEKLARRAPAYVHLLDVASMASLYGVYRWFEPRFWYHAKQPVSFECLVPYVRSIAQVVATLRGRSAKCVIVDLDNTIWGGVVGDDGVERLNIGEGEPEGEAFRAFQRYLLQLKERGVMLAVASKNEEANALAPFEERPEMLLKRSDFVAFRANWRPKSENILEIAAQLNIGLDAMVFVDDNPAERAQIRHALPEVRVAEIGSDPSEYAMLLDRTGWLDIAAVSPEDLARSQMYLDNSARTAAQSDVADYQEYVRALEQCAVVAAFEDTHLDRITQLTNKTNQFNLTTLRRTRSELEKMMGSPNYLTAYVRLKDRFGDNGLISVFAARGEGADLWVELWLMSCRVFNRGVEQMLCNHVLARARAGGYRTVHGLYIPTARNGLVRDHYKNMGFTNIGTIETADHWTLDVATYQPFETAIRLVHAY
ncbi:MAG TPA: HAD-IIIC family phosphatase [Longimicrobiales bacterium]